MKAAVKQTERVSNSAQGLQECCREAQFKLDVDECGCSHQTGNAGKDSAQERRKGRVTRKRLRVMPSGFRWP